MKHITDQKELESLINSRLSMQSTQRTLQASYGVRIPTLAYIKSREFANIYSNFDLLRKKHFLTVLAGPFAWQNAGQLIEKQYTH